MREEEVIKVRSRSDANGILHIDVPVDEKDTEMNVTVTIEHITPISEGKGYPANFFEQTYGSCEDDPIVIDDDEGIYEEQDESL